MSVIQRSPRCGILEAGKLAAGGDLTGAKKIAEEIYDRHYELVKNFLDENPHKKNQLILESCDKKLDEKTGLLKKYLDYTAKTGSLEPKMSDAIASIGEQISSYLLAQCGLALDILTQHIEAKKQCKIRKQQAPGFKVGSIAFWS